MQYTQFSLPKSLDKILRGGRLVHLLAHHLQELVELDCVVGVILADLQIVLKKYEGGCLGVYCRLTSLTISSRRCWAGLCPMACITCSSSSNTSTPSSSWQATTSTAGTS